METSFLLALWSRIRPSPQQRSLKLAWEQIQKSGWVNIFVVVVTLYHKDKVQNGWLELWWECFQCNCCQQLLWHVFLFLRSHLWTQGKWYCLLFAVALTASACVVLVISVAVKCRCCRAKYCIFKNHHNPNLMNFHNVLCHYKNF